MHSKLVLNKLKYNLKSNIEYEVYTSNIHDKKYDTEEYYEWLPLTESILKTYEANLIYIAKIRMVKSSINISSIKDKEIALNLNNALSKIKDKITEFKEDNIPNKNNRIYPKEIYKLKSYINPSHYTNVMSCEEYIKLRQNTYENFH